MSEEVKRRLTMLYGFVQGVNIGREDVSWEDFTKAMDKIEGELKFLYEELIEKGFKNENHD